MAAPVWVLSVNLETRTAAFTTGMADAAKSARASFQNIRESAREGGAETSKSFINAQQALGVLTNSLRGDAENALADIIRELSHTSAVMAALPFAAVAGGVLLFVNLAVEAAAKVKELREEQEKLGRIQTEFGTAVQTVFNGLDQRLIAAGQRADELSNQHLSALRKQLELIDKASMDDLIKQFESIAKAAEPAFKALEGSWYKIGIGSAGASHALDQFKTRYKDLLSLGKDKDASDLLAGTLLSAEKVLAAQRYMAAGAGRMDNGNIGLSVDYTTQYRARLALQQAGVGYTDEEVQSQEALVRALRDQAAVQDKIAELKRQDSANATRQTGNEDSARRSEAAKAAAASQLAIAEQVLQADRAFANAELTIKNASVQERLASDLDFAQREYDVRIAANNGQMAALDRAGKDYNNQLKALRDKALEIEQQHDTAIAELKSRAAIEQNTRDLAVYEQGERDKIAAQQQGSVERLAAIDSAIKDAEALNLQETDYYRQLGSQRVDLVRQMAQDELRLKADAAREAADNTAKMATLELQSELQQRAVMVSGRRMTEQQRIALAIDAANREFEIQQQQLESEAAGLDKSDKNYENRLQALQNKELQMRRAHANRVAELQGQAEIERNEASKAAIDHFQQVMAAGLTRTLMGYQSFSSMMNAIGQQVVGSLIQNSLQAALAHDLGKPKRAGHAAQEAFVWGWEHGGPAAPILAPVMAAGAFASVMAFAEGTDSVPGVGRGDVVPAMLTPGEGIVPGGVMDGLRDVAKNGGFQQRPPMVLRAHFSPTVHALDSEGIDRVLDKHQDKFTAKMQDVLRRMNY